MRLKDLRTLAKNTPSWHQRFMRWMMTIFCVGAAGLLSVMCANIIGSKILQTMGTIVVGIATIAGFLRVVCVIPFVIIQSMRGRR